MPAQDQLTLRVSGDAWRGQAQFFVLVDGRQVGDVRTATAAHARGEWQDVVVSGDFGQPASVQVRFVNDAWGGTPDTDRNLYVENLSLNGRVLRGEAARNEAGHTIDHAAALLSTGMLTFDTTSRTESSAAPVSQPDTMTLRVSGDAWRGQAQFVVLVDGHQVGGLQTATAAHASGQWQDVLISGDFGQPASVQVRFVNDAWGGTPDTDRNLYVESLSLNGRVLRGEAARNEAGQTVDHAAALLSNGTLTFDTSGGPAAGPHRPALSLLGVNLAGADFAGDKLPGVMGRDYTYPTHAEVDYYASKGMNVIRLPFLWERLQSAENGPLNAAELAQIDDVVGYATGKGLKVVLDLHNYGFGYGHAVGSAATPDGAFANLWRRLAGHFKTNADVIFGLMNEPHVQGAPQWLGSANAAIAAIRGAGATTQEILVPGTHWDGAWTWTTSDNAAVIGSGVRDPANNYAFDVHQYLDADGSGTHDGVVSVGIGAERLTAITGWAEQTGHRLFLGEFSVGRDPTSLAALDTMLSYLRDHDDVWQGATYWAGGPWWGESPHSIEPTGLGTSVVTDSAQMGVFSRFLDPTG